MANDVTKLELQDCYLDGMEGAGNEIKVKLRAGRKNKAGRYEHYELKLKVCRYGVKQILTGLRDMHVRDRERIAREQQRIQNEIDALKVTA